MINVFDVKSGNKYVFFCLFLPELLVAVLLEGVEVLADRAGEKRPAGASHTYRRLVVSPARQGRAGHGGSNRCCGAPLESTEVNEARAGQSSPWARIRHWQRAGGGAVAVWLV